MSGTVDVIVCLLPIVFLVFLTLYGKGMPAYKTLPCAALLMFVLRLAYFGSSASLVLASVLSGAPGHTFRLNARGGMHDTEDMLRRPSHAAKQVVIHVYATKGFLGAGAVLLLWSVCTASDFSFRTTVSHCFSSHSLWLHS